MTMNRRPSFQGCSMCHFCHNAKQEKFEEGWAQVLAEMVASSLLGAELCYSIVSTGKAWEFGRLQNGVFTKHPFQISATTDLQKLFDMLNWLFLQASLSYAENVA